MRRAQDRQCTGGRNGYHSTSGSAMKATSKRQRLSRPGSEIEMDAYHLLPQAEAYDFDMGGTES